MCNTLVKGITLMFFVIMAFSGFIMLLCSGNYQKKKLESTFVEQQCSATAHSIEEVVCYDDDAETYITCFKHSCLMDIGSPNVTAKGVASMPQRCLIRKKCNDELNEVCPLNTLQNCWIGFYTPEQENTGLFSILLKKVTTTESLLLIIIGSIFLCVGVLATAGGVLIVFCC